MLFETNLNKMWKWLTPRFYSKPFSGDKYLHKRKDLQNIKNPNHHERYGKINKKIKAGK